MRVFLLTDVPVWVRPLAAALASRGAEAAVAAAPEEVVAPDAVVNRISTRVARRFPGQVAVFREALARWEEQGVPVVNGTRCLDAGFSKMEQAALFARCGARTPRTAWLRAGGRNFPDTPALIKPPAGGFGKGIRTLAAGEAAPADCADGGWVEQERIKPADGTVRRVEILGSAILYEASTPWIEEEFNYCLAHTEDRTTLTPGNAVSRTVRDPVLKIARAAGMELGAIEYLLDGDGQPVFIDLNPVSSLHPQAAAALGFDPLERTAAYILNRAARMGLSRCGGGPRL